MNSTTKLLLICLLCFSFAVPGKAQGPHSSNDKKRRSETTATGCLLGQDGKFILITSKQSSILQLVPTPNLQAHIGHKVKLTGTIEDVPVTEPRATGAKPTQDDASRPATPSATGQLKVRKVKTISSVCDTKSDSDKKSWISIFHL